MHSGVWEKNLLYRKPLANLGGPKISDVKNIRKDVLFCSDPRCGKRGVFCALGGGLAVKKHATVARWTERAAEGGSTRAAKRTGAKDSGRESKGRRLQITAGVGTRVENSRASGKGKNSDE
jgi:hypothetical protein